MDMLKLFLAIALIRDLPWTLLIGVVFFLFFTLLLKYRQPVITKLAMLVISIAVVIGLLYGLLRFSGVITYASDMNKNNTAYCLWFDAFCQEDGYRFIHPFGCALIGIAAAVLPEWNARRLKA